MYHTGFRLSPGGLAAVIILCLLCLGAAIVFSCVCGGCLADMSPTGYHLSRGGLAAVIILCLLCLGAAIVFACVCECLGREYGDLELRRRKLVDQYATLRQEMTGLLNRRPELQTQQEEVERAQREINKKLEVMTEEMEGDEEKTGESREDLAKEIEDLLEVQTKLNQRHEQQEKLLLLIDKLLQTARLPEDGLVCVFKQYDIL